MGVENLNQFGYYFNTCLLVLIMEKSLCSELEVQRWTLNSEVDGQDMQLLSYEFLFNLTAYFIIRSSLILSVKHCDDHGCT